MRTVERDGIPLVIAQFLQIRGLGFETFSFFFFFFSFFCVWGKVFDPIS